MLEVLMPPMPPRVKKVKLAEWHKAEGDDIRPGELLAVIETNKVSIEIDAEYEGKLVKILVPVGTEEITAGMPLALIEFAEDALPAASAFDGTADNAAHPAISSIEEVGVSPNLQASEVRGAANAFGANSHWNATPLAIRIAGLRGVDLSEISGSGPYGRIMEKDVERAITSGVSPE